jgi:hypothetical protein
LSDREQLAEPRDLFARSDLPFGRELIEATATVVRLPSRRVHLNNPTSPQQSLDGSIERAWAHLHAARRCLPDVDADSVAMLRAINEREQDPEFGRRQRRAGHVELLEDNIAQRYYGTRYF